MSNGSTTLGSDHVQPKLLQSQNNFKLGNFVVCRAAAELEVSPSLRSSGGCIFVCLKGGGMRALLAADAEHLRVRNSPRPASRANRRERISVV